MLKQIEPLRISRLTQLEFGQHLKSICENLDSLRADLVTDVIFKNYLNNLRQQSLEYDKAMMQVLKSDETARIVAADKKRNTALFAIKRMLKVFEFSEMEDEREAFASLKTLFGVYKNIHHWNYEEKSNGIDGLIDDLSEPKYSTHISKLGMQSYVLRLGVTNTAFKNAFANRIHETAVKTVYDIKAMRSGAKVAYEDLIHYVLSMAKAQDNDEFNKSLNFINAVRKYYSDMLAKRLAVAKEKPKPMDITISAN